MGDVVPDGPRSIELMKEKIKEVDHTIDVNNFNFDKTASRFFNIVSKEEKEYFLKKYFTKVSLKEELKSFLELPWSYIFTLNIDDGIENTGIYQCVYPYQNAKNPNSNSKLVYKIHGDANYELLYNTENNIVFSNSQYIAALTSSSNTTIINAIKCDYKQKNLLFIGCSLSNEPDLKFIFDSVGHDLLANAYRTVVRTGKLSKNEEMDLEDYGINSVIIVNSYRAFYIDFVNSFKKIAVSSFENKLYFNPKIKYISSNDEKTSLEYWAGKSIFKSSENAFYKTELHITRFKISDLEEALNNNHAVLLQGRRFSGKTYVLCSLCESFSKYNILYFPSDTLLDESIISKLFKEKQNTLFLFDSNSLNDYAYQQVAHSLDFLKANKNKIIIAVNSKDIYLLDNLDAETIHISPKFYYRNELQQAAEAANKFSLVSREKKDTNLDYLQKLTDVQKLNIQLPIQFPKEFTGSERAILFLLCVNDKLFFGDISALDIRFSEVDTLIESMKGIIEKTNVSKGEKSYHSTMKLIHNSKYILLNIMNRFNSQEIIDVITYIVSKTLGDYTKKRLYVDAVLFDTLNQLFGKKSGAGKMIYQIYDALEKYLYNDMDYWLQRAKSIYRLNANDKDELLLAYRYAKKSYVDGDIRVQAKSALSLSLISCFISEIDSNSDQYELEAINYAYEAITSDYFKKIGNIGFNAEFERKNKNGESFYKKLIKICQKHKEITDDNLLFHKIIEIEKKVVRCNEESYITSKLK